MGNGEFKITVNGIKIIVAVIAMVGSLYAGVKGYTILAETAKLNAVRYEKIEPRVNKNEKDIIKIGSNMEHFGKGQEMICVRQEKMNDKLDKLLARRSR